MRPSDEQKKAALILALVERDHLLPAGKSGTPKRHEEIEGVGVTRNTLLNWLGGQSPNERVFREVGDHLRNYMKELDPNSEMAAEVGDLFQIGVMRLGQCLGFTRQECRVQIDQKISGVMSTFNIFNIDNRGKAADLLWQTFGGFYLAYRVESTSVAREYTGSERSVMRIPIAVRHPIGGNKRMSAGYMKIRCKAHVYSFSSVSPFEYDGYMTKKDGGGFHHWIFQSRNENADDLFYMATSDLTRVKVGDEGSGERLFLHGSMHSRNQDHPALAGVWPIVLEKVTPADYMNTDELTLNPDWRPFDDIDSYFMRTTPKLLNVEDLDPLIKERLVKARDMIAFSTVDF